MARDEWRGKERRRQGKAARDGRHAGHGDRGTERVPHPRVSFFGQRVRNRMKRNGLGFPTVQKSAKECARE